MGCGGSRADAIEPRYYESWTRETESTWLTNTDSESPAQEGGGAGIREDGKSAQTGVTTASATAGMLNTEKRNNGGPQCVNPMVHGTGATTQKQNGFKAAELPALHELWFIQGWMQNLKKSKWDTQKMSTKEVTINVTKNIRQSDRRKTKNCVN